MHSFFSANGHDRVQTADLLEFLHSIEESPWGDWYGKPLSAHGLSRLLRPYRIKTMPVKVDGETVRGYKVEQFADAFARALSVTGVTSVTSHFPSQAAGNAGNAGNASPVRAVDRPPLLVVGDPGYLDFIRSAYRAGHITRDEWLARVRLHGQVLET